MCFCIVPGNDAEVCQIAAIEGLDEFNVYAIPQHGISPGASVVNKLSVKHGVLFHDGQPVIAVRKSEALAQFLNWLKLKMPCVLLAHNAKAFDAKHLIKAVVSCDRMEEFNQMVLGFSDTLMAFRELFPDRKSCSQENLAKDLLGATYNAHNALHDVQMLQKLVSNFISNKLVLEHSFTLSWFQEYYIFLDQKNINLRTLLASTCVDFGRVQNGTQVDAIFSPFGPKQDNRKSTGITTQQIRSSLLMFCDKTLRQ